MLRQTLLTSRYSFAAVAAALFTAVAVPASAQDMRLRATVERVDGATYIVKDRDGVERKLTTTDKPLYVAMVKASMADIKPGMFVGSTAMPAADGTLQAVEVHIFPEAMRGTGEGHRPWDLKPQSTMTNASVETSVAANDGQVLTMKYKGGDKKIAVTPQTVVVSYAPGDKADVKPGTHIFAAVTKQPDGSLQTPRITYGKDGLVPPM
jgi:glucose/arabinose dehydrogenase